MPKYTFIDTRSPKAAEFLGFTELRTSHREKLFLALCEQELSAARRLWAPSDYPFGNYLGGALELYSRVASVQPNLTPEIFIRRWRAMFGVKESEVAIPYACVRVVTSEYIHRMSTVTTGVTDRNLFQALETLPIYNCIVAVGIMDQELDLELS